MQPSGLQETSHVLALGTRGQPGLADETSLGAGQEAAPFWSALCSKGLGSHPVRGCTHKGHNPRGLGSSITSAPLGGRCNHVREFKS